MLNQWPLGITVRLEAKMQESLSLQIATNLHTMTVPD